MEDHPKYIYQLNVSHKSRLENKVALVTGGGGSIGSAISYRLAIEGAFVGVAGRTMSSLEATIEQIVAAGVDREQVIPVEMDVTSEDSTRAGVERLVVTFGQLDLLVNNAGGSARGHTSDLGDQDLSTVEGVIDVNLLGAIRCSKFAATYVKHPAGRIVNFGSTIGFAGQRQYSEYSAAKSGIVGLTKSLALELGRYGTTVNMVTPGWVWRNSFDGQTLRESDMTALRRYGTPEEVAGTVAYLCSDEAAFVTGNEIRVDGGRTLGLRGES